MTENLKYNLPLGGLLSRNYRIVDFLGHGYEGEVYKVEEITTGIIRAAKLFYRNRFIRSKTPHIEYAKKLHSLHHCQILIQYHHQDVLSYQGQEVDFLVSDFVDGVVLSDFINKQPQRRIPPFEALHLFYALAKGIEQIHFMGEYHGDIHSDNIIIQRKGLNFDAKLIDLLHLGKPSRARIQEDVFDLITVFMNVLVDKNIIMLCPGI